MIRVHRFVCLVVLLASTLVLLCAAVASAAPTPAILKARSPGISPRLTAGHPHRSASAHASIIGGSSVSISAYPWLAFIKAEEPGQVFLCSGTVVAPRIILTAGHCVANIETGVVLPASDFAVATGSANLNSLQPSNVSLVSQTAVYPGFEPSVFQGDAGILILSTPSAAPAISLATASDSALLGPDTPLAIAGWGLTNPSAEGIPAELQAASTVVQSSTYCENQVGRYYPFFSSATQLCAIDPPSYSAGTCHGDSGGPAIARSNGTPIEIGITSLGEPECSTILPDVFTRVDKVSSWVASWIATVEGSAPTWAAPTTPAAPTPAAPTPAVVTPKVRLPRLTISRTKYFVSRGLRQDFRYRYRRGSQKRTRCSRSEREKVKCGVSWYQGGNDYYGTITIYYVLGRESVLWNDRYKIHWVDDYCWFHSGHRQTCVVRTRTR